MHVEDEMPERRQVADSEANRPDQEDCGEPVGPAPPDPQQDQQIGADFECRQQLAVERLEAYRLLETLRETVASVTHPFVLRPHPLHRPAHWHGAAEHQAVVSKVGREAGRRRQQGPQRRQRSPGGDPLLQPGASPPSPSETPKFQQEKGSGRDQRNG